MRERSDKGSDGGLFKASVFELKEEEKLEKLSSEEMIIEAIQKSCDSRKSDASRLSAFSLVTEEPIYINVKQEIDKAGGDGKPPG